MKKLISFGTLILFLQGCATSHIASFSKTQTPKKYKNILVLFSEQDHQYMDFDSITYNQFIKEELRNLDNIIFKQQLEKVMVRNISSYATSIAKGSDIFDMYTDFSYQQFIEKVDSIKADAILLINLNDYWSTEFKHTVSTYGSQQSVETTEEPNASYNCYLFDVKDRGFVCVSNIVVNGQFAGYDVLNNKLAKVLRNKLVKDRFIEDAYAQGYGETMR